jgi:hypothetical protein
MCHLKIVYTTCLGHREERDPSDIDVILFDLNGMVVVLRDGRRERIKNARLKFDHPVHEHESGK